MSQVYYYLLMSQTDFLENQVMEEILRERATFYSFQKKKKDFWILMKPNFVKELGLEEKITQTKFYEQQKFSLKQDSSKELFFVALVSLNKEFIKWVELRLGYFECISSFTEERKDYKSNGILGNFTQTNLTSPLSSSPYYVHPDLFINKYKKFLAYSTQV